MAIFFLSCGLYSWLQKRVLRAWLQVQKHASSAGADATEARLQELCEAEGCRVEDSDKEEEEEELQNSEPLDSDFQLSDSGIETTQIIFSKIHNVMMFCIVFISVQTMIWRDTISL